MKRSDIEGDLFTGINWPKYEEDDQNYLQIGRTWNCKVKLTGLLVFCCFSKITPWQYTLMSNALIFFYYLYVY